MTTAARARYKGYRFARRYNRPNRSAREREASAVRFYGIVSGEDEGRFLARLRSVEPSNAETLAAALDRQRGLRPSYDRIGRSPDLLRPIVAAKDVAEDGGGPRGPIAATVFDSYAPQLDLSFVAAVYGLAGLFLGSLMGELLVAALATAASLRRLSAGLAAARCRLKGCKTDAERFGAASPLRWDRGFESRFLQQPVCLSSE